jgi:Uncharacterized protein conserved in bacteria (DUF2314)
MVFKSDRMWVTVTSVKKRKLVGRLINMPVMIPRLMPGDEIKFKREHIIDIWYDDGPGQPVGDESQGLDHQAVRLLCPGCNGSASEAGQADPPTSLPPSSQQAPSADE